MVHNPGSRDTPRSSAAHSAEKWCFERGQNGAELCEDTENSCNALLKINPEIATGPCLQVPPRVEQSGSRAPPASSERQTPANGKVRNR